MILMIVKGESWDLTAKLLSNKARGHRQMRLTGEWFGGELKFQNFKEIFQIAGAAHSQFFPGCTIFAATRKECPESTGIFPNVVLLRIAYK